MKYLALATVIAGSLFATAAAAGHNAWKSPCPTGYTYFKGPKSSWPLWTAADLCVKPWKDNPAATHKS